MQKNSMQDLHHHLINHASAKRTTNVQQTTPRDERGGFAAANGSCRMDCGSACGDSCISPAPHYYGNSMFFVQKGSS